MKTIGMLGGMSWESTVAYYLETMVPDEAGRNRLNDVIFNELCLGVINPESKTFLLGLIEGLAGRGAEGVILGCTELVLLVEQNDAATPLFDTALIHARGAALYALGG